MSDRPNGPSTEAGDEVTWDDPFLDRVADRLASNYDLERDRRVDGETFDLYGRMTIRNQKHFLHPALSFARHDLAEHLFARRASTVRLADLDRLVALGHDLADRWIAADEHHYSTDFTFVLVAEAIDEGVAEYVTDFSDRTLLSYGFHGHYEVNLAVVRPDAEEAVASEGADVVEAFRLWTTIDREEPGLIDLIVRRLQL
ncbi:hypothetical protein [Natronorarus salvus]|uniref:hypothetical protein n=1 Tax=Natronorarus salvus TaxID=3117733 RepID=UPI002F26DD08